MAVLEWYRDGGPLMHLILAAGLAGLAIAAERLMVLVVRGQANGRIFMEQIIQLVRSDKLEDAIKACARSKSVLPDMGLVILRSRSRDEADLQNVANAAALTVLPHLTRRLQYLSMLATAAILLGLLGTMLGLRDGLASAALLAAAERPARLAGATALALIPASFGVMVAIPLVVLRTYLTAQAELLSEHAHEFSARLVNALIDRPDVRLGHR